MAVDPWIDLFLYPTSGTIGSLLAVTTLAATIIMIIVWAFANILNNDGIKAYVKMEFFELFYSLFLFALIFAFFPVFDVVVGESVPSLFTGVTNGKIALKTADPSTGYELVPKHFRYAKFFLESLFKEAVFLNDEIFSSYAVTGLLGDIYLSLDLFWEQRSFIDYNPFKGFFHIGNVIKLQLFELVAKVALITKFQELFMHVFISGFFSVFLGGGLILRSFQVTRRLGGLLMAIALALYFIFPLAYIFAGSVFDHVGGIGKFHIDYDSAEGLMNPLKGVVPEDAYDYSALIESGMSEQEIKEKVQEGAMMTDFCQLLSNETDPGSEAEIAHTQSVIGEWANNFQEKDLDVPFFEPMYIDKASRLIFFSMFFSFIGLMMTIASIRSLSALFGGDLEIAGLTHII